MHLLLLYTPLILVSATIILFMIWLISFSVLMYVIQRRHPRYYKKIGQPYTWFTSTDISFKSGGIRRVRGRAWLRYLHTAYKTMPDLIHRDKTCRRLTTTYRHSIRAFLVFVVVSVLSVLPQTALLFTGGTQTATVNKLPASSPKQISISDNSSRGASAPGSSTTQTTPRTQPTKALRQTIVSIPGNAGSDDPVAKPTVPSPAQPQSQTTHLTRADVNSVLSSVAPPGQDRLRKQDVCQSIVGQEPAASDVGPAGAICTDANLLTYSSY